MLRTTAVAGLLTACGQLEGPWPLPYAVPKARVPGEDAFAPGEERVVASVCRLCPAGCGIRVRVVEGRAVKIEGNVANPVGAGRLCDRGQAGLRLLYGPERARGPLRRVGARGASEFRAASWDEALAAIAAELKTLRGEGAPERLALLTSGRPGTTLTLLERFLDAYGSPNLLVGGDGGGGGDVTALARQLQQGARSRPAYDLENSRYVLSFGSSLAEAYQPALDHLRAYAVLVRGRRSTRAKIVQVEPRLSTTAAKADEWIPSNPGTDGAIALSIAHVLVHEGLYDKDFVAGRCLGFDDWTDDSGARHMGFRTLLLEDYAPSSTAALTGVAPATVVRIAREMAARRPAVVLARHGPVAEGDGLYSHLAIHALNALLGSIDRPGGIVEQEPVPVAALPPTTRDDVAARGLARPRIDGAGTRALPLARSAALALPDAVLAERPYALRALFFHAENPESARVGSERFRDALRKLPLVVSFSPYLDETTSFADWVLPDHTYLERSGDTPTLPGLPFPSLGASQPVVTPLYDTRDTGDVVLALAKALGGAVAASLPFAKLDDVLRHARAGVHKAQVGTIVARDARGFEKRLVDEGAWAAPELRPRQRSSFGTASGRFEFHVPALRAALAATAPAGAALDLDAALADLGVQARGDRAFLPHQEPRRFRGDASSFPLTLHRFRAHSTTAVPGARALHRPHLQEFLGKQVSDATEDWCELNPKTARESGVKDGDSVWVEALGTRTRLRARVTPGCVPGVVLVSHDLGCGALGGFAEVARSEPGGLREHSVDPLSGLAVWPAMRVRIFPT